MPTLYPLTLAQALANLRLDVADLSATRWTDAALTRALDRSRLRLSEYYPLITSTTMTTTAGVVDYALPSGTWWVDAVEYPLGAWPRRFVPFLEYRDTSGIDTLQLQLPPGARPDGSAMLLATAGGHTLDNTGTTVPERFWDCLLLGGQSFAYDLYLTNVLDNFEFADGMLRDRVDDTKSMLAWQQQASTTAAAYAARLSQIRSEFNAHRSATVHWGDVPRGWARL